MNWRKTPRTLVLTAGYVALVNAAVGAALSLRFDGAIPAEAFAGWARVAPAFTLISLVAFWFAGLYHGLWRYAGTATVFQIARGVTLSALAFAAVAVFAGGGALPPSLIVLTMLFVFAVAMPIFMLTTAAVGLGDVWLDFRRLEPAAEQE